MYICSYGQTPEAADLCGDARLHITQSGVKPRLLPLRIDMVYIVMAYIVMAYTVMAHIVTAYVVVAYDVMALMSVTPRLPLRNNM